MEADPISKRGPSFRLSASGVVLDWYRDHGSWFDRNELQQVVAFIRSGGLHKARELEQLELKEQEERIRMEELQMSALDRRFPSES